MGILLIPQKTRGLSLIAGCGCASKYLIQFTCRQNLIPTSTHYHHAIQFQQACFYFIHFFFIKMHLELHKSVLLWVSNCHMQFSLVHQQMSRWTLNMWRSPFILFILYVFPGLILTAAIRFPDGCLKYQTSLFFASHNAPIFLPSSVAAARRQRWPSLPSSSSSSHWLTSCLAKSSKYSHNSICK